MREAGQPQAVASIPDQASHRKVKQPHVNLASAMGWLLLYEGPQRGTTQLTLPAQTMTERNESLFDCSVLVWVVVQHQVTGTASEGAWGAMGLSGPQQHCWGQSKTQLMSRSQKRHSIDLGGCHSEHRPNCFSPRATPPKSQGNWTPSVAQWHLGPEVTGCLGILTDSDTKIA